MNTSTAERPRLVCRAVRRWISVCGDGTAGADGGIGSRHVETCASCRQYFAAGSNLEASLRRATAAQSQRIPAGLEQGIIRAVNQSNLAPRRPARPAAWFALAAVAASLALAIWILPRSVSPRRVPEVASLPTPTQTLTQTPTPVLVPGTPGPALAASEEVLPGHILNSLVAGSDALVQTNPVQDEVDSVSADTKSALHFLAVNFLPDHPKKAADEEADPGV